MADGGRTQRATAWPTSRWAWWALSLAGLLALPVLWALSAGRRDGSCRNLELVSAYAGSPVSMRSLAGTSPGCGLQDLHALHLWLALGAGLAIVAGALTFVVCHRWWPRAWLSDRFRAAAPVKWLAPAAAILDVLVKLLVLVGLSLDGSAGDRELDLNAIVAFVLPGLVWLKVFAFATVWIAAMFTLFAAFSRRRLDPNAHAADESDAAAEPAGLAVCCSGGGIRAASMSLGALGVLERTRLGSATTGDGTLQTTLHEGADGVGGLLSLARFVASVSGGGYTVAGWRAASATEAIFRPDQPRPASTLWPGGVLGDPDEYPPKPPLDVDSRIGPGKPSLYRHLQQRREFLRSGRGGLPASVLVVLGFLLFHLLLWLLLVVVVAWPIGRLTTTWYVVGARSMIPRSFVDVAGRQLPFVPRLYGPPLLFACAAVIIFLICMVQWNTTARRRQMAIGRGLVAGAAIIGLLLVGIPWLLDVVYPFITSNQAVKTISSIASAGGVVAIVVGVAKRMIAPRLLYLGGALLSIAAFLLAVVVAGQAATERGVFALDWVPCMRGTMAWAVLLGVLVAGYLGLCPRWWSLHTVYRNRLRAAFVTSRDPSTAPIALTKHPRLIVDEFGRATGEVEAADSRMWPVRQKFEPLLDGYASVAGPVHLVCCAMARSSRRATGVRALSFVVEPSTVTFYDVDYGVGNVKTTAYSVPTTQWLAALGSSRARRAEGTLSAAMSVSGAAVAPAMGRMDKGSTNALLALFNLRLGTWWPNPRYVPVTGPVRYPWVRLSYMLKEIAGAFDLRDHHVYVTDGGHRENLGLVELLRRRCRTVVCIDASGDTPGSFTTLREAAELARLEVGAILDLTSLPAPTETAAPAWAHHVLPVTYSDGGTATVVHIATIRFERAPDDLVAFGLEDSRFPHYSTGDQFLSEVQFRRIVRFGAAATRGALADADVRMKIAEALGDQPGS